MVLFIELEYTERLCYYVHGVRIENTPLPCLPAQANRAGRKTNAAPAFSYESSVSPISMVPRLRLQQLPTKQLPIYSGEKAQSKSCRAALDPWELLALRTMTAGAAPFVFVFFKILAFCPGWHQKSLKENGSLFLMTTD